MPWEREFFLLAAVWLQCRHQLLHFEGDKVWFFLGEMDYHSEMSLLLEDVRDRQRQTRIPQAPAGGKEI